ncbi:unnamed protein product [Toxocara canis]|uniref:SEFIR domain-containing protein n=1 Tax=Toxocara canis TaxID=6265 RepID=A0A3P7GLC1_TOXCA|nr:unnamed protein product [Toxocara canis]
MFPKKEQKLHFQVERDYVPSVIPIERADDGRCLCPVSGNDPFDNRVICSCIAADWKKVRLHRLERPTAPPTVRELNGTVVEATPRKDSETFWHPTIISLFSEYIEEVKKIGILRRLVVLSVLVIALLLLMLIVYTLYLFYRRYRARGKTVHIRFVSDRARSSNALTPSSVSQTPLIHNSRPNILLVYSHDCAAHEAAVIALAEYLRDVFNFEIHVDVWDSDEIERNLMDYISASILNADKVMVVNSMGALYRYQNKIQHETRIERKQHTLHDSLFESQIDQALMHPCVISVRFVYTPYSMVLPPLSFSLQYILPDNMAPLLTNLSDTNMKSDPRLFAYNAAQVKLSSSVSRMAGLVASEPNWFEQTHHRVPRIVSTLPTPVPPALPNGNLHSAAPIRPVHDHPVAFIKANITKPSTCVSEERPAIAEIEHDDEIVVGREISEVLPSKPDILAQTESQPETSTTLPSGQIIENIEMKPSKEAPQRYDDSMSSTLGSGKTPLLDTATEIIGKIRVSEEELPSAKQNGHVNGLVGRFVKGIISRQSDSGLIADMDSIDVSS